MSTQRALETADRVEAFVREVVDALGLEPRTR